MDLSAVLDVLHSSIPQETKDTIFRSLLDEENYRKLSYWLRINEVQRLDEENQGEHSLQRGGHGRSRTIRRSAPRENGEESGVETVKRSFVTNSKCKSVVLGANSASKKEFEKRGVKMTVKEQDGGKININLEGKDQKGLTLAILEIWEKIAKMQKNDRQLTGEQYEIVSKWTDTQRVNFSIRTGCSLTFQKRKPSGYMIALKAFSKEEADAGIAQISVDAKNAEAMEDDESCEDTGEYDDHFEPMNILLVGLESVGKSTLINSLANYLKFKRLEDAKNGAVDIITKAKCTVYDKTKKDHCLEVYPTVRHSEDDLEEMPMIYSFNGVVHAQSREIRIIDTLGIPSKGAANDWENIEAVVEAVKKLGEIHAVVLVINATEDNLAVNFMKVVKNLLQRFHRDILRNVLYCFTRAGGNFTQERVHSALKKFTDEMHAQEDMLVHFSNHSSFCFDNKCFADLIGSQQGFDVDLTQATDFWEKSAEQATKFFEKVLELPVFNAQRVVPTLHLIPQVQRVPEAAPQPEQPFQPAVPRNIIIIGNEGVGKSMFINSLANYAKFPSFEAACEGKLDILADATCTVYDKAKTHHALQMDATIKTAEQTEGCTIYTLNTCDKLKIVETKGIPKDGVNISEEEVRWFSDSVLKSVKDVNCVILLLDAKDNQIQSNFDKVVKPLLHQLPPALHSQILFCLTRSGPNFNEENLHKALTTFVQDLNMENVGIQFDRNSNSFCFDSKGFTDLFGKKSGIDADLTQAEEFWAKSVVQAKRLLTKISQCETVQLVEPQTEEARVQSEEARTTLNLADLKIFDSVLERETVEQLWNMSGGRPIVRKIVSPENWDKFLNFLELATVSQDQLVKEEETTEHLEANNELLSEDSETRVKYQTVVEQNPPPLPTTAPPQDHYENQITAKVTAEFPSQSTNASRLVQIQQTPDQMQTFKMQSELPQSSEKNRKLKGRKTAI